MQIAHMRASPPTYLPCPAGWTQADGKILNIQDNIAVFSLMGTRFGAAPPPHPAPTPMLGPVV